MTIENLLREISSEFDANIHRFPASGIEEMFRKGDSKFHNSDSVVNFWIDCLVKAFPENESYALWKEILSNLEIKQNGNFVLVNYKPYTEVYYKYSPEEFWNLYGGIYRGCRNKVIDIICFKKALHAYDKFFNVGELEETSKEIVEENIQNCKVFEVSDKLDGSIFCASCYSQPDSVKYPVMLTCTSHSLSIDPFLQLNTGDSWRLEEFNKLLTSSERTVEMVREHMNWTFVFEAITESDQHVVVYPESEYGLHLTGIRNSDGELLKYSEVLEMAREYGIKTTRTFGKSFKDLMDSLDSKKSDEAEGFVIRVDDRMYKLKYNDYVLMHRCLSKLTSDSLIIQSYIDGKFDDFISKVPQAYRERCYLVHDILSTYKETVMNSVKTCAEDVNSKNFESESEIAKYITSNIPKDITGYVFDFLKTGKIDPFKKKTVKIKYYTEFLDRHSGSL